MVVNTCTVHRMHHTCTCSHSHTPAHCGCAAGGFHRLPMQQCSDQQTVTVRHCFALLGDDLLFLLRYTISLHPVALQQFAREHASGRQVTLDVPNVTVLLDRTLCGLIFDNVLSNAFKHGHSTNPDVRMTITCDARDNPRARLQFRVSNAANPDRPYVTQDYIEKVLKGEPLEQSTASAMSNRVGLQHLFEAAKAHGMTASLQQRGGRIFFESQVIAQAVPSRAVSTDAEREADLAAFPSDLRIYCIDDSAAARRLLDYNMVQWAGTQHVHVFGKDVEEVATFTKCVLDEGDIAFLDQHLEYGGDNNVLGTDIVKKLVEHKYKGLICMRTGNVAGPDLAKYEAAGAHCTFGKDVPMKQMIEDMQVAYVRHVVRPKMLIEERNGSQLSFDSTDSVDTLRLRSRSYMLPGQVPPPEPEVDPQMVRTGSRCQSRTGGDSDPAGAFTDNILEDCESVQ